jgi:Carboxypeptidase regulatory-like domain/TonB dependent receptor-like, beta-barrel/TonB-dependent Receptor Plug Domain
VSFRQIGIFVFTCVLAIGVGLGASAGTTGGLHGHVTDSDTHQPLAGVSVTVVSPGQSETQLTSATGEYNFLSLEPDTYLLTAKKDGYSVTQIPGITIISDQQRSVDVHLQKELKSLGRVAVRGSAGLVRSGVVSDVYSVNAAGNKAAAPLGGAGALNQSYGAIASAPGVNYDQGQAGWYQNIYIRGGDIDQVAYEYDGVPVIRESDQGAVVTLSSLGQAEVQVYNGGTPASVDAPGLAGYINQVVKTGTYPGYGNLTAGIGTPTLYNKAMLEVGGATPDRNFTYYVATQNVYQGYRFGDQFNGASNPLFFYPVGFAGFASPANGTVYDGSAPFIFASGTTNMIAKVTDQETVANLHFGLNHHHDSGKDDIQFLYDNGSILQKLYGSIQDQGISDIEAAYGGVMPYLDGTAYNGQVFAPPNPALGSYALFPNSPQNRPPCVPPLYVSSTEGCPGANIPVNEREGEINSVQLGKLQYQRNINSNSYFRIFGYEDYATWEITGPVSANLVYGGQLPDYEVFEHKFGGKAIYSNQLSDKNLINVTLSYLTSHLETYSGQFANFSYYWQPLTNLIDSTGNCYSPVNGVRISCFPGTGSSASTPDANCATSNVCYGTIDQITGGLAQGLTQGTPPAGSPAALAHAQWIVTEPGSYAQIDHVTPYFTGSSITDQWRPNSRLTMNLGVRMDVFTYRLDDLVNGYPARAFWYHAYNAENCFGPGLVNPIQRTFDPVTGAESPCPAGTAPTDLVNNAPKALSETIWQPRFGATYQMNPDLVLRFTYGRYPRPAATSYQEYNTIQQNSASFVAQFLNLGYNTPIHYLHADVANNYDLSVEQHLHGTDMSYKLTPYYRTTQGQIQFLSLNAQGVLAGVNAGQQTSKGVEFAFTKGNFANNGWAFQLGATYLNSTIKYGNFPNGNNVIDLLNNYVKQYNAFPLAGNPALAGLPCFTAGSVGSPGTPTACSTPGSTVNPYFNQPVQPLFDRNGSYTTYSVIPAPFNNANGFATPFSSTLIINYKHQTWSVSPTFTFADGESYGSPLVWPGYDPSSCASPSATNNATSCSNYIFIPDKYTGRFDGLGAFMQPSRMTMSLSATWQPSDRIGVTATAANLIDHCWQRNFPWDAQTTCIYAQLASNLLAPAGNFVSNPPIQLAYPYGSWYNNTEIGQTGQKMPTELTMEMTLKL